MKIFHGKKKKSSSKSKKREWLKALFIAFIFILLLRLFAFQSFTVDNSKMESSLFPGDFVLVNKLGSGARLPITLLSLPFFSENTYSELIQLPYIRIPGFTDINNNDLIIFNYPVEKDLPIDKKTQMVSRCIGIPGDTIAIIDKKVFINGKNVEDSENCKYRYRVISKNELNQDFIKLYGINEGGLVAQPNIYDFFISPAIAKQILNDSNIKSINLIKVRKGVEFTPFFPQSKYFGWSLDYFGPITIPSKGKTITFDIKTIDLYKKAIEEYENNIVEIRNDSIYINKKSTNSYTFKMDYYFVMDDNRDNGKDSRYWGFIPENHIIGKISFVWFSFGKSNNSSNIRWNRLLKFL
jgi:signal peptidase I